MLNVQEGDVCNFVCNLIRQGGGENIWEKDTWGKKIPGKKNWGKYLEKKPKKFQNFFSFSSISFPYLWSVLNGKIDFARQMLLNRVLT